MILIRIGVAPFSNFLRGKSLGPLAPLVRGRGPPRAPRDPRNLCVPWPGALTPRVVRVALAAGRVLCYLLNR